MGVNDPMAKKILDKIVDTEAPQAPADTTITTLYVGDIETETMEEKILLDIFKVYGKVKKFKLIENQRCAFVCF